MKLSANSKHKLLDSANKVYLGYTALDFFKTRTFSTSSGNKSISDLCVQAITDNKLNQTVQINSINYKLILTPGPNNTYKVHFSKAIGAAAKPLVKTISEYEDQEVLNLLVHQEFTLETSQIEAPCVSNRINKDYSIGGAGKVDLYRTHLVTLYNIIEKIGAEEDISNLLVALATGSGKTYVQALWMFVLTLSDTSGVFAIPDKLANQFAKDLKRLLPDSLVNKMVILRDKGDNQAAEEALNALEQAGGEAKIIIGSSDSLLDNHYEDLLKANSDSTFLAFDEQHLIMKAERRRIRLIELSKSKLSMFLTATPNQETYALSGNKPVAIMSSGQKQAAGQGQFPHLYTHHARNITDRNKLKDYRFWTGDFWQTMLNGLLLRATNSIQDEQSSAAVSLVDDLPFFYHRKEGEENVRWRLQVPAARKMLCIIDDNESLVNFYYALQHASPYRKDVYRNGNVIKRADVANFFQIPDAEADVIRQDMNDKRQDYRDSLQDDEREIGESLVDKTLAEQLKDTIFHNLIEYVLTDVTGLDEIEHNRLRKLNMEEFKQLVLSRYQLRTADYYQQKLAKEIDPEGAMVIGKLLGELSQAFGKMVEGKFNHHKSQNDKDLTDFIDNWPLYDGLLRNIKYSNYDFSRKFEAYASSHLTMGIMSGMKDAETPVEESRPFSGLHHDQYGLYDGHGTKIAKAKKRKNTALEILNDTSVESAFTPEYLNISEEQADAYFRLGFTGALISNKKTEGFSDRNLHTVINIAEEKLAPTNSPETQIQGIGRNRGLDDTVEPAYIHSLGRNQKTTFDLDHLKSDDYYPDLFRAQKKYNKEYIEVLGTQVSKKIVTWIYANVDKDESVNPDKLKRQVLKFIAQALRELNNKNSHQIKLSRAQLTEVISYAMKDIDKEIEQINKPYRLSTFIKVLGSVLNFLSECYYSVKRVPAGFRLFYHSWFGPRDGAKSGVSTKDADDVYIKILNKTSFKGLISKMSSILEFKNWLTKKIEAVDSRFKKNVESLLKAETIADFKAHQQQFIEPLFAKMVVETKREQVVNAIAAFPRFISLFYVNQNVLKDLLNKDAARFEATMIAFLRQVPGLEDLVVSDIVNYPKNMANLQELVVSNPLNILNHSPELRNELSRQLADYLKGDFLKQLSALVVYPQVKRVEQILLKDNNAQLFVQHCLSQLISGRLVLSPQTVLGEFKSYFNMMELTTLDEEIQIFRDESNELQKETEENFFQLLDEPYLASLTQIIKQLLVVAVNAYPVENRSKLLREASDDVKIRKLIANHGKELLSYMEHDKDKVPGFIFSKLITKELPDQIDIEQQAIDAKELFASKLTEITTAGVASLLFTKMSSPSSWSFTPQYIYDAPIAQFLQSDEFLDSISIMLPYNEWLQLRRTIKYDYSTSLSVARILIDKQIAGDLTELNPEDFLTLLNQQYNTQFVSSEKTLEKIANSSSELFKKISANPTAALNQQAKDQYAQLVSKRLLPLLASFIKEDSKKEQFLLMPRDNKSLYEFIIKNAELLGALEGQDDEHLQQQALGLINQLLPENSRLIFTDVISPKTHAMNSAMHMSADLEKITLTTFFSSKAFTDLMSDFLNIEDYTSLKAFMSVPENIDLLVNKMIAQGTDTLDKNAILEIIKSCDPALSKIATMDDRAQMFQDFISATQGNIDQALDKAKVSEMIGDLLTPVLFHNKFIEVMDEMIGFLDEQDMALIFEAMNKSEPASEAKQLKQFFKLIRAQDKEGLTSQFFSFPAGIASIDIEKLPAKKMIENMKDLIEEVLDCHCYYNQQDRKGSLRGLAHPKLIDKISAELRDIHISAGYSFLDSFARKIFYIQGIRNGLDAGGKINADANKHVADLLHRVQKHILRPMWWSTNIYNFTHSFIKGCRDLVDAIVASYYSVLNTIKSALNWVVGSAYFKISAKHADSEDYNNTAFDFAKEVNNLDPLNAKQVKKKGCKNDVVVNLEEFVAKRPARPGFFAGVSDKPVVVEEDEADVGFSPKA